MGNGTSWPEPASTKLQELGASKSEPIVKRYAHFVHGKLRAAASGPDALSCSANPAVPSIAPQRLVSAASEIGAASGPDEVVGAMRVACHAAIA